MIIKTKNNSKNSSKTDLSNSYRAIKKIAIVGLPNTGKSQVFNNLTGKYTLVANYPLTTVETKRAICRINGETCEVIDTPGLHCLYIHSEEELIVRDMFFKDSPDIIIQCIDANRLKQSLNLTADLLELGLPLVISLNAIDETAKKGVWIDSAGLSRALGVTVIESIAINGLGTKDLKAAIGKARKGKWRMQHSSLMESHISALESELPHKTPCKRKMATLLLLDDPFIGDYLKSEYGSETAIGLEKQAMVLKQQLRGSFAHIFNNTRNQWINTVIKDATKKQKIAQGQFSESFGQLSRHPIFGVPILAMVVLIMYLLVVNVANVIAGWMEQTLWAPVESKINTLVTIGWLNEFLIGDYGVLSLGLANAFLTILPILAVFFIAFNILEDIGYIPNLCVLTKRIFDKLGLTGSAIMSIILAFGCKTMATLTTKSIRSKKRKFIAVYLIAFAIPCAAQMALNMSILGRVGLRAFVIVFSVLASVWITVGLTLNKLIKDDDKSGFIQELPAIRLPNIKAVIVKTYYRLWWFIKEAVPVFIIAAVVLFVIDKAGLLVPAKNLLRPLVSGLLGLPLQMVDALILSMARHEAAAGLIIKLIKNGQLNYIQCITAVTITTLFVPCFANITAMVKEIGIRRAIASVIVINCTAVFVAGSLNWFLVVLF